MNPEDLIIVKSGDIDKIHIILEEFNERYDDLFDFTEFNIKGQWSEIWITLFGILKEPKNAKIFPTVLSSVRILTRDKNNINLHNLHKDLDCLLNIADLGPENITINSTISERTDDQCSTSSASASASSSKFSTETTIEALKCLCNLIFQSNECQKLCLKNSSTAGILRRVRNPLTQPYEVELFDMKLLFLITAFELETRPKVKDDLNGLIYLTEWLDLKCKERNNKNEKHLDLICEILKVLFNITANTDKNSNENEILNRRLTNVLRNILYEYGNGVGGYTGQQIKSKDLNVITQTINLLTNIPTSCLSELLIREDKCLNKNEKIFEGQCIKTLEILIEYLKLSMLMEREKLPAILIVLIKCVRCNSIMRHYIRSIILPPLKDVSKRPEVGNELRNHLCRFLTSVDITIRDLSAELLFVCCKENVSRMIKHTGYGNAAGLFATKGILDCRKKEHNEYSSDSEDSDTEEYKKVLHGVNPVLGCYEPPKTNPLEGMSDEQKEYEAMELVKLMDKLHKQGIVQPCRIGNDGKPQPVDHILQLQEELPQQQIEKKNKT